MSREWSQWKQDRANELCALGANSFPSHVVELVALKMQEVRGASVGPFFDTAHLVLGALGESLGLTAQEVQEVRDAHR